MTRKKIFLIILTTCILSMVRTHNCKSDEAVKVNLSTKEIKCIPCPEGCKKCYFSGEELICDYCNIYGIDPYYRKSRTSCGKCVKGCAVCTGPGINECSEPKVGFYYNKGLNAMSSCNIGCARCDSKGSCTMCMKGYKRKVLKKTDLGNLVECIRCSDSACSYCHDKTIKGSTQEMEICDSCAEHYTVANESRCQRCPDNCNYCGGKGYRCFVCEKGYQLDHNKKGQCTKIREDHCSEMEEKGDCKSCKFGFFIDKRASFTDKAKCADCSKLHPACYFCRNLRLGEVNKNSGVSAEYRNLKKCTSCIDGFWLNPETGACEKNPENCLSYSKGLCHSCIPGYAMDNSQKKCVKIELQNCLYANNKGTCNGCESGYYLQENGTCSKCHSSCLECSGASAKECSRCSVSQYKINQKQKGFNPYFFNSKYQCVSSCPFSEPGEAEIFIADEFSHTCVKSKNKGNKQEGAYLFQRSTKEIINGPTLIYDCAMMRKRYRKYLRRDFLENYKNKEKLKDFDKQCSLRGKVKERLSSEKETYYECDCEEHYYGARCQVTQGLYNAVNKFIHGIIKDAKYVNPTEKQLVQIVLLLNRVPANKKNLDSLFEFLQKTQRLKEFSSRNVGTYVQAIDFLMQNYYEILLEDRRRKGASKDIDTMNRREDIYRTLQSAMSYSVEFIRSNLYQPFTLSETTLFSIQGAIFNSTIENYSLDKPMTIPSPYIDTVSDQKGMIEIYPSFKWLHSNGLNLVSIPWGYANELFKEPSRGFYATNVVRLTIYKHDDLTVELNPEKTKDDFLKIKFKLRAEPSEEKLKKNLKCVRFWPSNGSNHEYSYHDVFAIQTDDADKMYAVCVFTTLNMHSDYYSVIYDGDLRDSRSENRQKRAMDGGDTYIIDDYVVPKNAFSGLSSFLGVIVSLIILLKN